MRWPLDEADPAYPMSRMFLPPTKSAEPDWPSRAGSAASSDGPPTSATGSGGHRGRNAGPAHESATASCGNAWAVPGRRARNVKQFYGLTLEDVQALRARQGHRCPICDEPLGPAADEATIDHCYRTGLVRGVLHPTCNAGLGQF
jgi:recombination endonuclease VII